MGWQKWVSAFIIIIIIAMRRQLRSIAATPHDVHVHLHSATSVSNWPVFRCRSAVSRFFRGCPGGLLQFIPGLWPPFIAMTWHNAWCAGVVASSLTTWPNSAWRFLLNADYICNAWQTSPVGYVDVLHMVLPLHTQYLALAWRTCMVGL